MTKELFSLLQSAWKMNSLLLAPGRETPPVLVRFYSDWNEVLSLSLQGNGVNAPKTQMPSGNKMRPTEMQAPFSDL